MVGAGRSTPSLGMSELGPLGPRVSKLGHTHAGVAADALGVHEDVLSEELHGVRDLVGPPEAAVGEDLRREQGLHQLVGLLRVAVLHGLLRTRERRVDDTGRDGVHTDPELAHVARHGQGHTHNTRLARRVSGLTVLTVERGHGRDVDDHTALPYGSQLLLRHLRRALRPAEESAHKVDLDDAVEAPDGVRLLLLAHGKHRGAQSGAVHARVHAPELLNGRRKGSVHVLLAGDVHLGEQRLVRTQLLHELLSVLLAQVPDRHLRAVLDRHAHGGLADTARPAGHDEHRPGQLHHFGWWWWVF
eukprot:Hpha_TRINITY_DN16560_c2_g7::TRINITY_DN16560_c2_g7_i3::g.133711::m.133711